MVSNGISYKTEAVSDSFINDIMPILELHRQELSKYEDMKLNPDWHTYKLLDNEQRLINIVARDENNDIVGYVCYILNTNLHYKDFKYANQDVFYVIQSKRGTLIAKNLVKVSEEILKLKGMSIIVHHTKTTNRFGKFLSLFGYNIAEVMYHKRIM